MNFLLIEMVLLFLLLCILRVPIAFSLGMSSLIIILQIGVNLNHIVVHLYAGLGLFALLAIPFFLLAGNLMNYANITDHLVKFAQLLVGRVRGGLAQVNILVSMVFGGISGSSTADAAATGSVLIPAMKKDGFSPAFSAAITAVSSTMGNLIPPSIYMIVYGSIANVSIEKLFLAGIVPGVLIGLTQMIFSYFRSPKLEVKSSQASYSIKESSKIFLTSIPALLILFLIIGGILWGWYTATEASVIAVLYTLFLALFFYRTVKPKILPQIFLETARGYSAILFTVASASTFSWALTYLGGPEIISEFLTTISTNRIVLLLLIAGILLILGTFLSEIATIIIFAPIFVQVQEIGGIDPVLMGVIVVMTLCLGLVTPPYGICLLISSEIAEESFINTIKAVLPFIIIFLLVVVLIIIFPILALYIPSLSA